VKGRGENIRMRRLGKETENEWEDKYTQRKKLRQKTSKVNISTQERNTKE
jgi:hypothetical protein